MCFFTVLPIHASCPPRHSEAALVQLLPGSRLLRWLVAWVPDALKPKALHYGWVLEVSWRAVCVAALRPLLRLLGSHAATA